MYVSKWWLVLELYLAAVIVDAAGHSNLAIAVAVAATVALLAALDLDGEPNDDDEHGLTLERLALVLVYARAQRNPTGDPCGWWWLNRCRRLALGLDRW